MCSAGELAGQENSYSALEVQPGLVRDSSWLSTLAGHCRHSPLTLVSIVALTPAGVEDEAASTGLGVSHAVRAEVELVTNCLVWVSEVTVGSGTAGAGLGWLEILSA